MPRLDGRADHATRPVSFVRGFVGSALGSCLVSFGRTRVLCTVVCEASVPPWMRDRAEGRVTAEYAMLPASTGDRKARDGRKSAGVDGRSQEIQRLIGRSLRAVVDATAFPGVTLWVDCDVVEADGGTRCASITGAYVALRDAETALLKSGKIARPFLRSEAAAVSVAIKDGAILVDPDYAEDAAADADMNVVATALGDLIEVQATAERALIPPKLLLAALERAQAAIATVMAAQRNALLESKPS
jgi:ribonuclease PH